MFIGTKEAFLSEDTSCIPEFKMAAAAILFFAVQDVSSDKKCSIDPRNICILGDFCTQKCSAVSPNDSTK